MRFPLLCILFLTPLSCSSDQVCDGSIACDTDCDGEVDSVCELSQRIEASTGGIISVDEGPLAGFSLEIPPSALAADTTITVSVLHDLDLQTEPWALPTPADTDAGTSAVSGDVWLYDDAFRTFSEVLADWGKLTISDMYFILEFLRVQGLGASELTYDLGPEGLEFASPASLRLPYLPDTDAKKELYPALRIAQWSSLEPSGRILGDTIVDPDAHTITSPIEHFSDFQVKTGFADAFAKLGGKRADLLPTRIEIAALGLINSLSEEGPSVSFDDVQAMSEDLARQMICGLSGTADFSTPDIAWNDLMGQLSTMPSLFQPGQDSPTVYKTGHENTLITRVENSGSPMSFATEFHVSMGLNNNNVFDALITMQNIGQGVALGSQFESMDSYHPSINDLNGAHYHMAGLALLSLYSDSEWPSLVSGFLDEGVMSGLVKQAFEPGEMLINLAGSHLAEELGAIDPDLCQAVTARLDSCVEGTPLPNQAMALKADCGRTWPGTTDASGIFSLPVAPAACTSFWIEATVNGTLYSSTPVAIDPAIGGDLGGLTIPEVQTSITGMLFDDSAPPQPLPGAIASFGELVATADTDGSFAIEESWTSCEPIEVQGSYQGTIGLSSPTQPGFGTTDVGSIIIGAQLVISNQSGTTTDELGGAVTFDVALAWDPGQQEVTVSIASEDGTEGSASPAQMTFNEGNWDVAQSVTVTGLADSLFDGDVPYTVSLQATGIPQTVELTNLERTCTYKLWTPQPTSVPRVGEEGLYCERDEFYDYTLDRSLAETYERSNIGFEPGAPLSVSGNISLEYHEVDKMILQGEFADFNEGQRSIENATTEATSFPSPFGPLPKTLLSDTESYFEELTIDYVAGSGDRVASGTSVTETLDQVVYRFVKIDNEWVCRVVFDFTKTTRDRVFLPDDNDYLNTTKVESIIQTYTDGTLVEASNLVSETSNTSLGTKFWGVGNASECDQPVYTVVPWNVDTSSYAAE